VKGVWLSSSMGADQEHDADRVPALSASPTFGELQAQLRRGRGPVLPQRSGSQPVVGNDGVGALCHHAACFISLVFP
jgi:hypothetical protein